MASNRSFKCREHERYASGTPVCIVSGSLKVPQSKKLRVWGGEYHPSSNPNFNRAITDQTPNRHIKNLFRELWVEHLEFLPLGGQTQAPDLPSSGALDKQLYVFRLALKAGIERKKIGPPALEHALNQRHWHTP